MRSTIESSMTDGVHNISGSVWREVLACSKDKYPEVALQPLPALWPSARPIGVDWFGSDAIRLQEGEKW